MRFFDFSLWRAVVAFLVGLLLVIWPEVAVRYLVMIVGFLFFLPGIVSLFVYLHLRSKIRAVINEVHTDQETVDMPKFPLQSIGSLLLGLWMLVTPDFFANILTFMLGCALILLAFSQISSLVMARTSFPVRTIYYLVPTLILLSGLFCVFNPVGIRQTVMIILGVTSMVYALNECYMWFRYTRIDKSTKSMSSEVEDAVIVGEEIIDDNKK